MSDDLEKYKKITEEFCKFAIDKRDKALETITQCNEHQTELEKLISPLKKSILSADRYRLFQMPFKSDKLETIYNKLYNPLNQECTKPLRRALLTVGTDVGELCDLFIDLIDQTDFFKHFDDHLDYYHSGQDTQLKDVELFELEIFFKTIKEINYYEESGLAYSEKWKSNKYQNKIKTLKKKADELQYYSPQQIEIQLPVMSNHTMSFMSYYLHNSGTSKDTLDFFLDYFGDAYDRDNHPDNYKEFDEWYKLKTKMTDLENPLDEPIYTYKPPYTYKK